MKGIKFTPTSKGSRGYSSEFINGEPIATGDGVNYGGRGETLSVTLDCAPIRRRNDAVGWRFEIREIDPRTGATIQRAYDQDCPGMRQVGFILEPPGPQAQGSLVYESGALVYFRFAFAPVKGNMIKTYYFYDPEACVKIPKVKLDMMRKCPICGLGFPLDSPLKLHPHGSK